MEGGETACGKVAAGTGSAGVSACSCPDASLADSADSEGLTQRRPQHPWAASGLDQGFSGAPGAVVALGAPWIPETEYAVIEGSGGQDLELESS
jgi:hypothetical protein